MGRVTNKTVLTAPGAASVTAAIVALALLASVAVADPPLKSNAKPTKQDAKAANSTVAMNPIGDNTPLTETQKIVHLLNRMAFGPRPGDVEKVRALGLHRYIEQQLTPEKIDDALVETKVAPLSLLKSSASELAEMYRTRQKNVPKMLVAQKKIEDTGQRNLRAAMDTLSMEDQEALRNFMEAQQKVRAIGFQLQMDKIIRASESERQFQEVMVDFWSNHFNIDMRKSSCATSKIADERDVIRQHIFGNFRDLLGASAKSPAMLVYLDNAQSSAPRPDNPAQDRRREDMLRRAADMGDENAQLALRAQKNRGRGGLNENYAREIMELHTLGVDGGYTQKDVTELARVLTGWGVMPRTGDFFFTPNRHDKGEKEVLGIKFSAGGGIEEGEKMLDVLAMHPSTIQHISTKLCRRLVSDNPPESLVNKCVVTWKKTNGNLREIYRTIVTSPEFFSRAAYRQKIKSPFEYAVSSVRALGGTFNAVEGLSLTAMRPGAARANLGRTLAGQIAVMGQPLYQYQAPTGYPEESKKWVSSGALISRLNFSLALVGKRLSDIDVSRAADTVSGFTAPADLVNKLGDTLLHGEMSPSTRATLLKQVAVTPTNQEAAATDAPVRALALVLGSPEFQRR